MSNRKTPITLRYSFQFSIPWEYDGMPHGVQRRMIPEVFFFVFLRFLIFCFVVARPICDLVHAVEAMYGLP